MKTKSKERIQLILLLLGGLLLCLGIYYLVDTFANGAFLDWFYRNYITTYTSSNVAGSTSLVQEPNWLKIKNLLLVVLIVTVLTVILLIFYISRIYAAAKVKQTIEESSLMIHEYMEENTDYTKIFPPAYAPLSVQMAEIKSVMAHHEQILKEETSRKNDLITYLAHDLKTPLTSIIGYLSLLSESPDLPEEQKLKYIDITLKKSQRLESLINEFFEITRYNLQQIHLEKERIDLSYMLIQMADEFYPLLASHKNTIRLDIAENLTVWGDPDKLARVFNNILKNALAYSYENTEILVKAAMAEKFICISFSNHGNNIPEEKLNTIFDKFFRMDESRGSNLGGAGLGLAIAKEIITLHGGTIQATSKQNLITFFVRIPLY